MKYFFVRFFLLCIIIELSPFASPSLPLTPHRNPKEVNSKQTHVHTPHRRRRHVCAAPGYDVRCAALLATIRVIIGFEKKSCDDDCACRTFDDGLTCLPADTVFVCQRKQLTTGSAADSWLLTNKEKMEKRRLCGARYRFLESVAV